MMPHVNKEELLSRLELAIEAKVGIEGLNKFGAKYLDALKHRNWFYITEVMDLSDYAGYDLTISEPAHLSGD